MGDICENEWNPGKEQVPDQADVPPRFAVCHARADQPDAHGARGVEQDEYSNVMPVADGEISNSIDHESICFESDTR
jgi:hypothetical protein